MIDAKLVDLLQSQLTLERTNEQYYRALSASADIRNRPGATAYFIKAAGEEMSHAKRVRDYLVSRGEEPAYGDLPTIPAVDGNDYPGMFLAALAREKVTTQALCQLWLSADDDFMEPQTVSFLQNSQGEWPGFLQEQTDSELELNDFLLRIKGLGPDGVETFDQWLAEQMEVAKP